MIGTVVGNYKILQQIGEGGMGSVFKGVDVMLDREVAIKSLRPELARKPDLLARFRSEAVTLAKLNHPNIATLFSFFRSGDDFYMVMEFVDGPTLDDIIRDARVMTPERAVPLFCQALEGIDHAHNMGILHRDIKSANIMVSSQDVVKVTDFGIARVLGEAGMTRQGAVVGTIEYMSPERIQGREIDRRSDIYALGVVLYEMLTGRGLFSTTSEYELMRAHVEQPPPAPRELQPGIPQAVEAVIMRSLAKKPEYRIPTAAEFQQALWAALRPADVPATRSGHTPVPAPQQPPRPKQTVLYEEPEPAASAPAPPPPAPPPAVPETRFVPEATPPVEPPPPRSPPVIEKTPEPAAAVAPPPEPPAPVEQEPKVEVRSVTDVSDGRPIPSSLAETIAAPPVLPPKEAERETTATPPPPAATPRPPADPAGEQTAPDKAALPVIAAPTLGMIDAESDDSRWKLYAGVAAAILVLAGLGWALMSGGAEPSAPAVISDTPGPPPEVSDGPDATPPAPDAAGAGTSPAVARPSIPLGGSKVAGRPPPRDRPGLREGSPPSGERPPSQVAGGPPKKAPPEPPTIEPAKPPQAVSPEEVAAAAKRARERLRQQAIKALEK